MKKLLLPAIMALVAATLLTGCVASIGNGEPRNGQTHNTLGQQLIDLKKAHDSGAINDADYETQKARLLNAK